LEVIPELPIEQLDGKESMGIAYRFKGKQPKTLPVDLARLFVDKNSAGK